MGDGRGLMGWSKGYATGAHGRAQQNKEELAEEGAYVGAEGRAGRGGAFSGRPTTVGMGVYFPEKTIVGDGVCRHDSQITSTCLTGDLSCQSPIPLPSEKDAGQTS